jgi:hypothetical protein
MKRRRQVDRERFVPPFRRELLDRRKVPDHRVIHEDVDRPALQEICDHGLDGLSLRQVSGNARDLDAEAGAELVRRRYRFCQVMKDDIGTRAGKAFRHGQSQPCRRPGHECPLSLQHLGPVSGYFFRSARTSRALRKASTRTGTSSIECSVWASRQAVGGHGNRSPARLLI